ncbi:hypothetical protein [Actinocorallia longicatena]|uniref:Anti-sigma U factor RsuA n=1 Tax=Actinocorallia longicatena TaxID=111803 RepID=A0ABP6QKI1_9ACTN
MSHEFEHTDVAAYALGVLNDRDRRTFEAHLSGCRFCNMELADLSGMRTLLQGIDPPPKVTAPATPIRAPRRRWSPQQWMVNAAAGVLLLLGGFGGGVALSADEGPPSIAKGEQRTATNAATGTTGTAVLDKRSWGTWFALDVANIKGPFTCELIAVTKSGNERVAGGWNVSSKGYGVPGSPEHLKVEGGIADSMDQIDRLEVRSSTGKTVLVIPV